MRTIAIEEHFSIPSRQESPVRAPIGGAAGQFMAEMGRKLADLGEGRLADMDAATSPKDLLAGGPRLGQDRQTMVVDLCQGYRIVFTANHSDNPTTTDGHLDWPKVRRIRILRIEREHV